MPSLGKTKPKPSEDDGAAAASSSSPPTPSSAPAPTPKPRKLKQVCFPPARPPSLPPRLPALSHRTLTHSRGLSIVCWAPVPVDRAADNREADAPIGHRFESIAAHNRETGACMFACDASSYLCLLAPSSSYLCLVAPSSICVSWLHLSVPTDILQLSVSRGSIFAICVLLSVPTAICVSWLRDTECTKCLVAPSCVSRGSIFACILRAMLIPQRQEPSHRAWSLNMHRAWSQGAWSLKMHFWCPSLVSCASLVCAVLFSCVAGGHVWQRGRTLQELGD
jgi:hypothetical protein